MVPPPIIPTRIVVFLISSFYAPENLRTGTGLALRYPIEFFAKGGIKTEEVLKDHVDMYDRAVPRAQGPRESVKGPRAETPTHDISMGTRVPVTLHLYPGRQSGRGGTVGFFYSPRKSCGPVGAARRPILISCFLFVFLKLSRSWRRIAGEKSGFGRHSCVRVAAQCVRNIYTAHPRAVAVRQ